MKNLIEELSAVGCDTPERAAGIAISAYRRVGRNGAVDAIAAALEADARARGVPHCRFPDFEAEAIAAFGVIGCALP